MKKNNILTLLMFILFTSTVSGFEIKVPESIFQGGVVTVFIKQDHDSGGINTILQTDNEVFSKSRVFSLNVAGTDVDIALLGVPSTMEPGIYSIIAESDSGETSEHKVIVKSRDFLSEDIPLSRSMTTLRKSDDVKKAEQWRELLNILLSVDTQHKYEEKGFKIPVDPLRTTSFFGDRRTYRYDDGTSARSIHTGIDYSAEPGTPVYAAGKGRVVFSGERIISGNTVVIEHLPGVYSLYYHMNSLMVSENEMISKGGQIGTVGATGLATGAHLHWEIRVAGVAVDPNPLMKSDIIDKDFILSNIERQ